MKIQLIKLDNNTDAAIFVNGEIVASVDTNFKEDGSISNLESIAERLATATNYGLQLIEKHPTPPEEGWSWDGVLSSLQ